MIEKRMQRDRRHEPRGPSAERITWRTRDSGEDFWGYVSDRSLSSVSFMAATKSKPSLGQEVEIVGPDLSQEHCRVMRITPYDGSLSLIGCRRVDWNAS